LLAGVLIVAALLVLHISVGTVDVSPGDVVNVLTGQQTDERTHTVVWELRLPRALVAICAGAMQALAGGMLAGAVVLLSMRRINDPMRLVLMGVAMNALLYAAIITIVTLGQQQDVGLLYLYLLGSLANRTWLQLQVLLPWAAITIPLALLAARPLNLLQLGDEVAEGLGLRVTRMRMLLLLLSAALVAVVVAVAGPIAFVALMAPHMARRALGTPDARLVLPIAALMGAVLLTAADLVAKNLFDPLELPVGVWTTLIGGPLLLLLLRRELGGRQARQ
jgi:iron complex transport system permease protein